MEGGPYEPRSQRWPALLVLLGVSGMVPIPLVRRAHELIEQVAWSVRGLVHPAPDRADAQSAPPLPLDARVAELLATLRRRVLPPRERGWQRDGRFGVVALSNRRDEQEPRSELFTQTPCVLPPDEPVMHGEELLGFTRPRRDGSVRIERLTRRGSRTPACAGEPGKREARFLALGDGSATLRVSYVDDGVELREGDLAWAIDPPASPGAAIARVVGGAWLGRLVRGDLPEGAERDEWRVAPLSQPELLAEVAIRFPSGFPPPTETDLYPLATELSGDPIVDPRRAFARIGDGREAGLLPGSALSCDGCYVGTVLRAGYGHALVRTLADPGVRVRALLLRGGEAVAFDLVVVAVERDAQARPRIIVLPPPCPDWDGALVVTAAQVAGTPEGLVIGALAAESGRCTLVARRAASGPAIAWRLPGAWSSEP
jgi:hypothetical protein